MRKAPCGNCRLSTRGRLEDADEDDELENVCMRLFVLVEEVELEDEWLRMVMLVLAIAGRSSFALGDVVRGFMSRSGDVGGATRRRSLRSRSCSCMLRAGPRATSVATASRLTIFAGLAT